MEVDAIDLVFEEARLERSAQLSHFQSLDARAGFILGFTGVLVAIAGGDSRFSGPARVLGTIAALVALLAFFPRRLPVLDLEEARKDIDLTTPEALKLHLLDARVEMVGETSLLLERRARRLLAAAGMLGAAIVTMGIGALLPWLPR